MKQHLTYLFILYFLTTNAQIFTSRQVINQTDNPEAVASADFNNDGYPDIVYSSITGHKILMQLFNPANKTFDAEITLDANINYAVALFTADLDADGFTDILSVSQLDNRILWYKNNNGQTFTLQPFINTVAQGASSVIATDIDLDGDLDVVSAEKSGNKILWYENDGSGNFIQTHTVSDMTGIPVKVISADLNNDDYPDLIAGYAQTDQIIAFINQADGSFSTGNIISDQTDYIISLQASDFNDDGNIDLVSVSKNDNKLAWYKNKGNAEFTEQLVISDNISLAYDVDVADFDLDNYPDIICTASGGNEIYIFKNTGNDFVQQAVFSKKINAPKGIVASDFDNDGDLDFASALSANNPDEIAWFENGRENFVYHEINNNNDVTEIVSYDINNDNLPDIFYTSFNGVYWVENQGNGNFGTENVLAEVSCNNASMKMGDLDNDNDADIIVADAQCDQIFWLENLDGNGSFSTPIGIPISELAPVDIVLADYDADNDLDFAVSFSESQKLALFRNDGSGNFTQEIISDTIPQCRLSKADIDHDGDTDLVYSTYTYLGALLNDGTGNFNNSVLINTYANTDYANVILPAHINDDDYDDLVTNQDMSIKYYANNQNNSFTAHDIDIWDTVYDLALADFDQDNDTDIVTACRVSGYLHIVENHNYGTSFTDGVPIVADDAYEVDTADYNNDGWTDIAVGSFTHTHIGWMENYMFRLLHSPYDYNACEGGTAYFSVLTTGAVTYQWQENSGNGWTDLSDNTTYEGTQKARLIIHNADYGVFGNTYRCLVYDKNNTQIISDEATLHSYQTSVECVNDQTRTADAGNTYTVQGDEFDVQTVYNRCGMQLLTLENSYNYNETLDGAVFDPGNYTIVWGLIQDGDMLIDYCSFDLIIEQSTGITETEKEALSLHPNPAGESVELSIPENTRIRRVQIIDMTGNEVISIDQPEKPAQINLFGLNTGIYFVKIYTGEQIFVKKLIKK